MMKAIIEKLEESVQHLSVDEMISLCNKYLSTAEEGSMFGKYQSGAIAELQAALDNVNTITKDNFYFVPTSAYAQPTYNGRYSSGTYTCTINPSLTYTNNTLILSGCTGSKGPDSSHDTGIASLRVTGNIYCIY